ncbi:MAG: hypothetical protein HYX79_08525 [Chloroflexi bacterium]|nr:hypothetical protein [Chloroflexota bacterium]
MKKLLIAALIIVSMFGVIAVPATSQTPLSEVTLWADNLNVNAGNVTVAVDGDTLVVTYSTVDGWQMTETHLYASATAPTKSAPGRFPFKHEDLGGVTEDSYQISLSQLGIAAGDTIFLAAQAALQQPVLDEAGNPVLDEEGNQVYVEESAWAEGDPIPPAKNWAMFFSVTIAAEEPAPVEPII